MKVKKSGISYTITSSEQKYFVPGMPESLAFEKESIDLVETENMPLEAVTENGIKELNRVLKPGGRILIYGAKTLCKEFVKICREHGIQYVTYRVNRKGNLICGVKPFIFHVENGRKAAGIQIQSGTKTLMFRIGHLCKKYARIKYYERIADRIEPRIFYACYHFPEKKGKLVTYFLGEGVNSTDSLPEGASALEIPEGDYAVFTVIPGSLKKYTRATLAMKRYIYRDWLTHSCYKRVADGMDIEFYDYRSEDPIDGEFEIWIPVRRRKEGMQ